MTKSFPICYETFGDPNNPCIILIMGLGGQLITWPSTLTQGLVEKGFYVITFDNRDAGLSRHYDELGVPDFNELMIAKQQGKTINPPYTLEDMAADVITLMNELHISKSHIAGMSMGGIIAQYVALNYSDRVLSLTCIATTTNDPHLPPATPEILEYFVTAANNTQTSSFESLVDNKIKIFKIYDHPDYFDEEKAREYVKISLKRANDPNGFKRLLFAMISTKPTTDKLKQLKIPCLIIHGDYDPVFSLAHGKELAALITGSRLEVIEKMGHGLPDIFCKKIVDLMTNFLQ